MRSIAQFVKVLIAGLFLPAAALAAPCAGFNDVDDTSPFCGNVTYLKNRLITLGCLPNLFCPSDPVSRLQMAAFLNRLGDSLFPLSCAPGQVMKWDGVQWSCSNDLTAGGGGTGTVTSVAAGTGLQGSPNPITTAGAINLAPAFQLPQGCANGQIPKSNGVGGWTCAADASGAGTVTSLAAGSGITLTPNPITTTGTIAADTTFLQRRVGASCVAGSSIRAIAADGTVTCQTDGAGPNAFVQGGNNFGATGVLGTSGGGDLHLIAGSPVLRLIRQSQFAPSVIGGQFLNNVLESAEGVVIGGGGQNNVCSSSDGGRPCANIAYDNWAVIGGGRGNRAGLEDGNPSLGTAATVGGGQGNTASAVNSTVGGGANNTARADHSTVPGGFANVAGAGNSLAAGTRAKVRDPAAAGTANGDEGAFLWADSTTEDFISVAPNEFAVRATGGVRFVTAVDGSGLPTQLVSINASGRVGINTGVPNTGANLTIVDATQPSLFFRGAASDQAESGRIVFTEGGSNNCRGGFLHYDGAANRFFIGTHPSNDCLVGNDIRALQFARDTGFFGVLTVPSAVNPIVVGTDNTNGNGAFLSPTGVWTNVSSAALKENFAPVDKGEMLAKLAALPIQRWNYRGNGATHIGPTAEDFGAAFGLGSSTSHIGTVDADGVALAAIQGLNAKMEEQAAEVMSLKRELAELRRAMQALMAK